MQWMRWCALALAAPAAAACSGGSGNASETPVRAPARSGTVLVMDGGPRTTAPGEMLGFVHGLHRVVLDGDRIYAGMTAMDASRDGNGARAVTLANGLTAQLLPAEKGFQLKFSTGETVVLREHEEGQ